MRDLARSFDDGSATHDPSGHNRDMAPHIDLLEALEHPAALLDLDGLILAVNRAWNRFANDNGGQGIGFEGVNYLRVCDGIEGAESPDARRVGEGLRAVLSGARRSFDHTYPCHGPSERRWFKMVASRTGDWGLVLHVDVTGEYQTLPSHSLADHFAGMAHDLMNPLNALMGFIALAQHDLGEQAEPVRLRRHVGLAAESAEVLQEMFVDMMNAGRDGESACHRTDKAETEPVAVSALAHEECIARSVSAGSVSIRLDDRLPDGLRMIGAIVPIRRIIQNTLSNAIKYNHPNGEVTVGLSLNAAGGVEIQVDDTGIGIAETDLPRVFERYRRLGNDPLSDGGHGIGLCVIRELTEAYDGMVTLTSTPDVGTSVRIAFPSWRTVR